MQSKSLASTFKIHNDHYTISKEEFKLLRESATRAGFGNVMAMMDLGSFDEWCDKILEDNRILEELNEFARQLDENQKRSMENEARRWRELYKGGR